MSRFQAKSRRAACRRRSRPQFELAFSGWYWQITRLDATPPEIRASKSLFATQLPHLVAIGKDHGDILSGYVVGPGGHELRMVEREIDAGDEGRFLVQVAANADVIQAQERSFEWALAATFPDAGAGADRLDRARGALRSAAASRAAGRGGRDPPRRGRADRRRIPAGRGAARSGGKPAHRRQPRDRRARAHSGRQSCPRPEDSAQRAHQRGRFAEPGPAAEKSASRPKSCASR